jgi:hypothetical protein
MNATFYLTITKHKNRASFAAPGLKLTLKKPGSLNGNQIAVKVNLELPNALFEKPEILVNLKVPGNTPVGNMQTITATVQENIAELISSQLGTKVHVTVAEIDSDAADKLDIINQIGQ